MAALRCSTGRVFGTWSPARRVAESRGPPQGSYNNEADAISDYFGLSQGDPYFGKSPHTLAEQRCVGSWICDGRASLATSSFYISVASQLAL